MKNIRWRMHRAIGAFLFMEMFMLPCVYASGQNDTLSLLFIGDLMQHDAQLDLAFYRRLDAT